MKLASFILAVSLMGSTVWFTGETLAGHSRLTNDEPPMDCSFSIKGTFDGVTVNVTITVSNVSLAECLLMKAAVKAATK
jgi:hypothetical protein